MVTTPRIREELNMWETELSTYEHKVSTAADPFEEAHWHHMAEYAAKKILMLEQAMYEGA